MRNFRSFGGVVAAALGLLVLLPLSASAEDYAVKGIKYHNEGSYMASLRGVYHFEAAGSGRGKKCYILPKGDLSQMSKGTPQGGRRTWNYGDLAGYNTNKNSDPECFDSNGAFVVPVGAEVWARVKIDLGDTVDCRKSGAKFFYHPDGDYVTYETGGTTLNNNRCSIRSKPKTLWKDTSGTLTHGP